MDDFALLQEYLKNGSDRAFEELVGRYTGLVYSSALRRTGDPHLAEDVTQAVFLILTQRPSTVGKTRGLRKWLFRATRDATSEALRQERRRKKREPVAEERRQARHEVLLCWRGRGVQERPGLVRLLRGAHEGVSHAHVVYVLAEEFAQGGSVRG